MDHYETLGVGKDADPGAIKKAFKRAAREAHPDRGGDHQQMVAVNRAYQTLSDAKKRADYDATGEDAKDGILPDEMRAMTILWAMLAQAIDQVESGDWVGGLRLSLAQNIVTVRTKVTRMENQVARYERQMKQVKRKTEGPNLLVRVWEQRIHDIPLQIEECNEELRIAELALTMLKEYETEFERTAQIFPSFNFKTGFGP